ncbi:CDP-alcohol phosphatidyltransferase family protein [Kribbella deserti]|uniref:CDP-alcohol phosphatidyltransferase family protein n=1 Tax=Kribbella deserti TaxID=1926257 RepID=A0ABV6QIJ4_9ACTN
MSRVDRTASIGELVAALASAQKPAAGTPAYSRFINRRLGRYLAAVAYKLGLTPNQVSAASALCSFAAIFVIALVEPTVAVAVLVTALLVLGYALDSADGQVARLRGGGSPVGEWLDHMIDCTKIATLHLAVLIGLYRFTSFDTDLVLLIPMAYAVVGSVTFFGLILIEQLRRNNGAAKPNPRGESVLKSLLIVPSDYGVLCLVFVTLAWPAVFLTLYGLLLAVNLLLLLAAVTKWYGELTSLGAQSPQLPPQTPPEVSARG